jgi:isocitrate lyase
LRGFREELADMGYKYQFITLAGWHSLNLGMFELSRAYRSDGMYAYSEMQQREFAQEKNGFRAAKHQTFVGTTYFDAVQTVISHESSTTAMEGSTESEQFGDSKATAG